MPMPPSTRVATSLRIVRIAIIGAVIGFAVLAQRMVAEGGARGAENAAAMRWTNAAFLLGALAAILVISRRHEREPDPRKRQTLNVLAWAAGETAVFFGIVHWLMVGSPVPFYVGLATLLASFVLVPIRE